MTKRETISRSDSDDLLKETAPVESICNQPNIDTREAINEARSGKTAGKLDMSSLDGFLESVNKSRR